MSKKLRALALGLSAFALVGLVMPAMACDGHKDGTTTTKTAEKQKEEAKAKGDSKAKETDTRPKS